jgi:hypothetical protein
MVDQGNGDITPPDELRDLTGQGYHGDGKTLNAAFDDAWERGKSSGHRVFRVQQIIVWGENPISGYRVIITP